MILEYNEENHYGQYRFSISLHIVQIYKQAGNIQFEADICTQQ